MGCPKIIFVNDRETYFEPVPYAKYDRFLNGREAFPDYAGQPIKVASITLEGLRGEKHISGVFWIKVKCDSRGYVDPNYKMAQKRWAIAVLDNLNSRVYGKVAQKWFSWSPSDELAERIFDKVLDSENRRLKRR